MAYKKKPVGTTFHAADYKGSFYQKLIDIAPDRWAAQMALMWLRQTAWDEEKQILVWNSNTAWHKEYMLERCTWLERMLSETKQVLGKTRDRCAHDILEDDCGGINLFVNGHKISDNAEWR